MRRLLSLLVFVTLTGCKPFITLRAFRLGSAPTLHDAEEYEVKGEYDRAITAYRMHIHNRLKAKDRPEGENPYFYHLKIGDIELKRGQIDKALEEYEFAERNGVEAGLIADRYRQVGRTYEERRDLKGAIGLLERYRDRDPLLFDAILDRLAKDLVKKEEQK